MIMGRDRSRSTVRNKCKGYSKGKYMVRLQIRIMVIVRLWVKGDNTTGLWG